MARTAIVTGASSGIGAATAKALASTGITVMLAARRTGRLETLRGEIRGSGGTADYREKDVSSYQQVQDLARDTVDEFGRIDVLVNNAGIMPLSYFDKLKVDEWDRMIDVNIKGVLYGMAAAFPYMSQQGHGHFINFSSIAGHLVFPTSSVYSATKYAVRIATEGIREEMAGKSNVRTTIISPGSVQTELFCTVTDDDAAHDVDYQQLQPSDIANAIVYAVQKPASVNVNEIIVRPTPQPLYVTAEVTMPSFVSRSLSPSNSGTHL